MRLDDLIDCDLLERMLEERFVSEMKHPTEPLAILNYTQRTQFDRVWNPVTRQCRGLIYDFETGDVVARPWPKFFNCGEVYDEAELAADVLLSAMVTVTDKLDGSLGILYPTSDGYAVATRGSFTSEQALHATAVLHERYADFRPIPGLTYLFEIVYPQNRIVVDYAGLDDLVLLGVLDIESGYQQTALPAARWQGPCVETFAYRTFVEALTAEPRPNSEGLVVHFLGTKERVKLKQEDYVRLHRIVTGLNERTVWEHLGRCWDDPKEGMIQDLLSPLPEEFHDWVEGVAFGLQSELDLIRENACSELAELAAKGLDRKDFARHANESEYRPYLFMLLDGKDPRPAIWKTLRPSYPKTLVDVSEAVA